MNQYYLIAQLPSLEIAGETTALPITEERFYELCKSNLGKKAWNALCGLTLVPKRQNEKSNLSGLFIDRVPPPGADEGGEAERGQGERFRNHLFPAQDHAGGGGRGD